MLSIKILLPDEWERDVYEYMCLSVKKGFIHLLGINLIQFHWRPESAVEPIHFYTIYGLRHTKLLKYH